MRKILLLLILPCFVFSLEKQPWFGDVYEFHFLSKYAYSRYHTVNGAIVDIPSPSNDNLLHFDLAFSPTIEWSIDSDLEFAATPRQDFGFRAVAFQGRYLLKDDIIGDMVSLAIGGNFRVVSDKSIRDVSCPYHSSVNFEANISMGKEFTRLDYWRFRIWGYGAVGIANQGSPWLNAIVALEGNQIEKRKWALFLEGSHGYGRRDSINVNNFHGYGRVRQKSLDLGIKYGFRLGVWGTLSFEYKRRLLAKLCPDAVNTFTISYLLPFSF